MSRKRPDLIERSRYPNPLPLPPYAPKLLSIPTPASRYAHPSFASRLSASHALPLVVDADAGMPLAPLLLAHAPSWGGPEACDVAPRDALDAAELDDEDRWLLSPDLLDPAAAAARAAAAQAAAQAQSQELGESQASVGMPEPAANAVTWLRRTEYLSANEVRKERRENG